MHGRLCLTRLNKIFVEVTRVIDEDRPVDVVCMNYSKVLIKSCIAG